MKRTMIALVGLLIAVNSAFAAVTISTSSKTFQKQGGAASVAVSGDGAWTAVSDSSWLVIGSGASGNGDGKCLFTCNANNTADTRIGHITIGGNTYTVTQYGYVASISPTTATFDRKGGKGTVSIVVDAGVTWTAKSNDSWLSVEPLSGMSVGTVTYTVAEYPGVTTRVGSLTVAGQTFTVTQTGVDVNIDPEVARKDSNANIVSVDITALAQTKWEVTPNAPWISVIDKESGYGDYKLMLALASNPSFERRTATVSIGSATLTVVQDGLPAASLSINPPEATASASGAYGNIAVYATPDAPWTAESLSSWITISEGEEGAGNGNIKYVASANPNLAEREGTILITPPYKTPNFDLCAGLIKNDSPEKTFSGSQTYTSFAAIPSKDDNAFALALDFKVGELGCVNRLLKFGSNNAYLNVENRLYIDDVPTDFVVHSKDTLYTMVFSQADDGTWQLWAGPKSSEELALCYEGTLKKISCESGYAASNFKFGYLDVPTVGYLTKGTLSHVCMWSRNLTDDECRKANTSFNSANIHDAVPAYTPVSAWMYYPMDDALGYAKNSSATLTSTTPTFSRFGMRDRARKVTTNGYIRTGAVYSDTIQDTRSSSSSIYVTGARYSSATASFWVKVDSYPSSESALFSKTSSGSLTDSALSLSLSSTGRLKLVAGNVSKSFTDFTMPKARWAMVTLSGISKQNIVLFVDGVEIGNVACSYSVGDRVYKSPSACSCYDYDGYYTYYFRYDGTTSYTLGKIEGEIDDLVIFSSSALTSEQVRALYEASRPQFVYHTVKQGMQYPQLSETAQTAPAEGATRSVDLTLAQLVNWDAKSNTSWIKLTGDTAGAGSARIDYEVESNPTVIPRTGSITIAGLTVTVMQEGLWADVSSEDTSFGVDSDSGYLWVDTEGAGQWTAVSDVDWISIWPGYESGNGAGPVMFIVDDYDNTTQSRSGTITVAGKKVVITQQGYELSIDPQVADLGSNAGAGQFGVAAPIDAVWEAIADCDWITIVGARTGIGDGTIQYTVTDNLTGETRVGRIVIGGKTYTITQRTTLPLTTQVVGKGSVTGAGNYNQGTKVTLKATAANGYVFSHWSGDAVGNDDSVEITVDIEKNVTATFIPEAAAQKLAEQKAAQGGFYTRDQIHALEMGNLVFDVDASGTARVGVQLMETSDLSDPNGWKRATLNGNPDVGQDGTVGMKVKAEGNAKFFKVVMPEQQ